MYIIQGLLLALVTIAFVILIMFECYFIYSWRRTNDYFYLGIGTITAILIIIFGIGLGIWIVDYVGGA